jgi:hypothetical protein
LNAAKRYFDSKGLKKLPSYKTLQQRWNCSLKRKALFTTSIKPQDEEAQRLDTILHNIEQTLGARQDKKHEQETINYGGMMFMKTMELQIIWSLRQNPVFDR